MKKTTYTLFLFLVQYALLMAQPGSPSAVGKKVKNMPESKTPWIIFSDRDDNFTTTVPGGSLVMKKLAFMEPFYVSAEKNGFLKLIRYQPGILKGRKIMDKKMIQSYGWIAKSKMLLWQRSYTNRQSGYAEKSIAIISGPGPLNLPDVYYDRSDSLYVYNSPELRKQRTKVRLHEINYIFKKSEDGKKYLIGNEEQLVADSAKRSIFGWVAGDAVHNWGQRLYVSASRPESEEQTDSAAMMIYHQHGDPLLKTEDVLLKSSPVIADRGPKGLLMGHAADVYDKSSNSLVTINGTVLKYPSYLNIRKNIHKVNVMFVIDGGSTMARYFSGLTNTIHSFDNIFNEYRKVQQINFGAIVYRDDQNCVSRGLSGKPLSSDYRQLSDFLAAEAIKTQQCNGIIGSQPVYDGIRAALDTLKKHPFETNLVILIGTTGDHTTTESLAKFQELTAYFGSTDARLLAIQVYSDYNQIFNNFVLQSKKLVSDAAMISAERKKSFLVKGEGLINTQTYNTTQPDSISYYLDYPENSLVQGGVVFPTKGAVNSSKSMNTALKRFLKETDQDIREQISSLDSAFRLAGITRRNLSQVIERQLPAPVSEKTADQMPHNAFKYYLTADAEQDLVEKSHEQLQYSLILSTAEFGQLNEIMSLMMGQNLQADQASFRRKLARNYLDILQHTLDLKIPRGKIKAMKLPQYLKAATGMPLKNPVADKYTVRDLRSHMPQRDFETWLRFLMNADDNIKQATQTGQQFISNGKTYYHIAEQNFSPQTKQQNP